MCCIPRPRTPRARSHTCTKRRSTARPSTFRLCCPEGASAAVLRPGDLRPTVSESRTDTASHHLRALARSVRLADEDVVVEEVEAEVAGS
jgi:hypothetical protein